MKIESRREFIVKATLASMALAVLPQCKKSKPLEKEKKKYIVVGAGIAGLTAAAKLKKAGNEVTVIEASDRYGGRIMTVDMNGYKADFGASWIHGIKGNPLYELTIENAIRTEATHYEPSYWFDIDGSEITTEEWQQTEQLLTQLVDLAYDNQDISLEELLTLMKDDISALSERMQRIFYGAVRSEIEIPYAVDSPDIAARALITNDSFPGNDVVFPGGMSQLTEILARDLEIVYNTFVTKISYSDSKVYVYATGTDSIDPKRSCIACHSGNQAGILESINVFSADKVIVALPPAMLTNGIVEFDPPLPQEKQNAVNSLGIGTMNKVFLRFEESFWDENAYFLQYLKEDYSKIIEFFSPAPTGSLNILVGVFAGQHARSIEKMNDDEVLDIVMSDLKNMYGDNIPQPVEMKKTTWHTNKFSLGSYPHLKPGADLSACDIIAAPLNNKVYFAGDACSSKYMATAHGAYISALNAAEKAMK
jgi:monoamine oxidase